MKKITCNLITLFFLSLLLVGCSLRTGKHQDSISRTGFYFDTVISITLYDNDNSEILDRIMTMCDHYEHLFSLRIEGSDIYKLNEAKGKPVKVDKDTADLIERALYYSTITDGHFDITIGGISSLWNFSVDPKGPVPKRSLIEEGLKHVNYKNVKIEYNGDDTATITLLDPESKIDLGAVAKGYIADKIKASLINENVSSAIIKLGGNVLLLGSKPDGSLFKVGIQDPSKNTGEIITTVSASDVSVVTSGVYERYFEENGIHYHHILDAETGYPSKSKILGLTILSPTSTEGDCLSTSCFILGYEKGMELIESLDNVEALFITEDRVLHRSSGFPEN